MTFNDNFYFISTKYENIKISMNKFLLKVAGIFSWSDKFVVQFFKVRILFKVRKN